MKKTELKELLIRSLDADGDNKDIAARLEEAGISYDFSTDFGDKVINAISPAVKVTSGEVEFVKNMNYVFYRIAFTGIAAILVLMLTIFLSEGSLSLNAFLGLGNGFDESILYVLAGN